MTREEFIDKWGASMGHGFTDEELSTDLDSVFKYVDNMLAYKSSPPSAEDAEAEKFPDIDFRKDIAEELSRQELIDRLCEMHQLYTEMRKEWNDIEVGKTYPKEFVEWLTWGDNNDSYHFIKDYTTNTFLNADEGMKPYNLDDMLNYWRQNEK